jgi:hypothetical protein
MGFDGLFFGRLDYADKNKRKFEKTMEMVWNASQSLYQSSWLFTGALFNGYGPPEGFCFDDECQDEPIMDNPRVGFMKENFENEFYFFKMAVLSFGCNILVDLCLKFIMYLNGIILDKQKLGSFFINKLFLQIEFFTKKLTDLKSYISKN